jgi:hypothetical protein
MNAAFFFFAGYHFTNRLPMKKPVLFSLFFVLTLSASAQVPRPDSLRQPLSGAHIWVDFGLVPNASLQRIAEQLAPLGITQQSTVFSTFGVSQYQRLKRHDGEFRFWRYENADLNVDNAARLSSLQGWALGGLTTYRLVDTRRFMVGPGAGFDFQTYRLRIDGPTRGAAPIQSLLTNPAAYQSVRLNGFALTAQAALTVGYKFRLFPKAYEFWQLNGRVGYHLPLLYTREWTFDGVPIADLDAYRPSALYGSVGIVGFLRADYRNRMR